MYYFFIIQHPKTRTKNKLKSSILTRRSSCNSNCSKCCSEFKVWTIFICLHSVIIPLTIVAKFTAESRWLPALHLKFKCWSEFLFPVSRVNDLSEFADNFWKAVQVIPMKLDGLIIKASRAILRETCQDKFEKLVHCLHIFFKRKSVE